MAKLTGANVKFHSDNAKGPDSRIEIIVTDAMGTIVAQESNSYGIFTPGASSGPYSVPVVNEVEKHRLQPGGTVTLNWLPVPAFATWVFDFTLDLSFEDGSNLLVTENGVDLNAGANSMVYGL